MEKEKRGKKLKRDKLGTVRIPLSIRKGGVMGGKKPKYNRKRKHRYGEKYDEQ